LTDDLTASDLRFVFAQGSPGAALLTPSTGSDPNARRMS
jgi:hypothetical protein